MRDTMNRAAGIALSCLLMIGAEQSFAQSRTGDVPAGIDTSRQETYVAGIWVDPDGCQHYVMDDGIEGYMTPARTPDGRPICGQTACFSAQSDQFFETASAQVSAAGQQQLREFFRTSNIAAFKIEGHTDSRGSDGYNQGLSERRAQSVAAIARAEGVRVQSVLGYGEGRPVAPNTSASNMARNRRVDVICVN